MSPARFVEANINSGNSRTPKSDLTPRIIAEQALGFQEGARLSKRFDLDPQQLDAVFLRSNQTNRRARADAPDILLADCRRAQKKPPVAPRCGDIPYSDHQFHCGFDPERAAAALQLTPVLSAFRVEVKKVVLAKED